MNRTCKRAQSTWPRVHIILMHTVGRPLLGKALMAGPEFRSFSRKVLTELDLEWLNGSRKGPYTTRVYLMRTSIVEGLKNPVCLDAKVTSAHIIDCVEYFSMRLTREFLRLCCSWGDTLKFYDMILIRSLNPSLEDGSGNRNRKRNKNKERNRNK